MALRNLVNQIEEAIMSLILVAMTLLVFVQVVARFGFDTGIDWAQEATLLLSGWFVILGASYGVKAGAHIGVDVFVKMLPSKAHRAATVVAVLACLLYCVLFLIGSWDYVMKMRMIGIELEDIPVPKWIASSVLIIGFVLLIIRFLQLGWKVITGQADGFHFADEAEESMHLAEELKASEQKEGRS